MYSTKNSDLVKGLRKGIGNKLLKWMALGMLLLLVQPSHAQYFGRNKARYKSFDFKVLQSPNFEMYYYFKNDTLRNRLAQQSERWYKMHQQVLEDTIETRNPLIFYSNHADFQQTTVIGGMISVGTGGVTEGLKNRVVMPVMESHAQTDHVLGHELVHAFQYNLLKTDDSTSLMSMRNLPLWMVEGLAEYMSIGYVDSHTAMWMRDAVLNDNIPSLEDLSTNPNYFPYRYGQAFWAFVAGVWGDEVIPELFRETAKKGVDEALQITLGIDQETMSNMWKKSLIDSYQPLIETHHNPIIGKKLIHEKNAGDMNVSPAVSPNGKYVAFLSEKNLFSIDLFLADAKSGRIVRKLSSTVQNSHIDAFSFLESAGAWSPDSKRFAFVVFSKGKNKLVIVDAQRGKTWKEIAIPGVPAFSNPTWSPDGKQLVVTGLVEGQSDLYSYNLDTRKVKQLTNDYYSDIQPSWSSDGRYLVFATDRLGLSTAKSSHPYAFNLALLDVENNTISNLPVFEGADNFNPVFAPDNQSVYFLSNRDGFRNLYNYSLADGKVYQLTDYFLGISGITAYSPALSVARNTGQIVYSHYFKNTYNVYGAEKNQFTFNEVKPDAHDVKASTLPPFSRTSGQVVAKNLSNLFKFRPVADTTLKEVAYRPKFKLDYLGSSGVGVATSRFGTGMAGGVDLLFSDILSNNQIYAGLALNGEIYDFGGQIAYLNQKRKINWGVSVGHIPYRSGRMSYSLDTLQLDGEKVEVENLALDYIRLFQDQAALFAYLPLSQTRRFEAGASFSRYSYRVDRFNSYYHGGLQVAESREKLPAPEGFNIGQANIAYVGDNSFFGTVSPLQGHRYRFQAEKYFGALDMYAFLADYRRYYRLNPVSIGFRGYHYARYGKDVNNGLMPPLFLGMPGLVHGYGVNTFSRNTNPAEGGLSINQLVGNRVLVGNLEVRLPFTGPEKLSLIKSGMLMTELNFFMDGGLAWSGGNGFSWGTENRGTNTPTLEPRPVFSTGVGLRVNVFGYLIVEPYFAIPWQNGGLKAGRFGLNFTPGW